MINLSHFKKPAISILKYIGKIKGIPFSLKYFLFRIDKRLHYIIPEGLDFVYHTYLSDVSVRINTIYPIEKKMLLGEYDQSASAVLKKFLNKNSVVFDIGANVGALTLQMAKIAESGKVIAIEPGPTTCRRLIENLKLNPGLSKRVTVINIGVSDRSGKLYWTEDMNNRGNANLLGNNGIEVEVQTIDKIVDEQEIKQLDFIKIDVEGMEYEVINGGLNSIQLFWPVIYYETLEPFREIRGFDLFGSIFELLNSIGYKHFYLSQGRELVEVSNMKNLASSDMIAIPVKKKYAL